MINGRPSLSWEMSWTMVALAAITLVMIFVYSPLLAFLVVGAFVLYAALPGFSRARGSPSLLRRPLVLLIYRGEFPAAASALHQEMMPIYRRLLGS
jgi:hypothetical protein